MLCAALTAMSVVGCDGSRDPNAGEFQSKSDLPRRPRNITASQVKVCPDGHTTLKNVPIVYGRLILDAKTEAAFARHDFWPGGCAFSPDSPTNRVVCTTCGFSYDSRFGDWHGFAWFQSLNQSKRPFSTLMASFPVPSTNQSVESPRFHQSFNTNGVTEEGVSYSTSEPFEEVAQKVDSWFKAQKLKPMRHSSTNQGVQAGPPQQTVKWKEMNVNAYLNLSQDGQASTVSVTHSRRGELSP
jgi:hypothetical protein